MQKKAYEKKTKRNIIEELAIKGKIHIQKKNSGREAKKELEWLRGT